MNRAGPGPLMLLLPLLAASAYATTAAHPAICLASPSWPPARACGRAVVDDWSSLVSLPTEESSLDRGAGLETSNLGLNLPFAAPYHAIESWHALRAGDAERELRSAAAAVEVALRSSLPAGSVWRIEGRVKSASSLFEKARRLLPK